MSAKPLSDEDAQATVDAYRAAGNNAAAAARAVGMPRDTFNSRLKVAAARWPAEWGATRHRYAHGFHLHHKAGLTEEDSGVELEIHQAPIPPDSWHYGAGYCSGRSVQAITYHRELGGRGRVREIIMDGALQEAE